MQPAQHSQLALAAPLVRVPGWGGKTKQITQQPLALAAAMRRAKHAARGFVLTLRARALGLCALAVILCAPCVSAIGSCTTACKSRHINGFVTRAPANASYPSHLLEPTDESGRAIIERLWIARPTLDSNGDDRPNFLHEVSPPDAAVRPTKGFAHVC